jgi:beta-glucanase (GH16 family)
VSIDLANGQPSQFSGSATSYGPNGGSFVVAKSGDAPTITSNFYMMFGRVDVVLQAAPGVGIVSSMVLQSDDLDEVDLEFLGASPNQVQTNYFGKGQTTTYDRYTWVSNPGNMDSFHTYTVVWTSEEILWQIDGQTVRTLTPATAEANQYPQTPMQLKLGIWSGGDPSNPPGTIGKWLCLPLASHEANIYQHGPAERPIMPMGPSPCM